MDLLGRIAAVWTLLALALGLVPPAPSAGPDGCGTAHRGSLVSTVPLGLVDRADVATELRAARLADTATYGVNRYRLAYCTVSPSGTGTVASGLLALPSGAPGALPVVAYAHGTISARTDAPSFTRTGEGRLAPMVFAAEGLAVAAPDYLGLGISTLTHPYLQASTEASTGADLLAAARTATEQLRVPLSGDVFVAGHSQGGQAAMAIAQALSGAAGGSWHLRAVAPMAGPYDLSGIALPAALDPARTDPHSASAYLAYLLVSWKSLYGLYADPREVFAAPYAATVEPLFDGTHGFDDIAAALPPPQQLLRPETVALLGHPTGRLAAALRENDVCRWAPPVPVRLYVGQRDRDVVPEHAQRCRAELAALGTHADVVDLGAVDHIGTAIAALPAIRDWFLHGGH